MKLKFKVPAIIEMEVNDFVNEIPSYKIDQTIKLLENRKNNSPNAYESLKETHRIVAALKGIADKYFNVGYKLLTLQDLSKYSYKKLMGCRHVGDTIMKNIIIVLEKHNLQLAK